MPDVMTSSVNYQKLYTLLFNACTDAIRQLEHQNYGMARQILIRAQQTAEETYLNMHSDASSGTG